MNCLADVANDLSDDAVELLLSLDDVIVAIMEHLLSNRLNEFLSLLQDILLSVLGLFDT